MKFLTSDKNHFDMIHVYKKQQKSYHTKVSSKSSICYVNTTEKKPFRVIIQDYIGRVSSSAVISFNLGAEGSDIKMFRWKIACKRWNVWKYNVFNKIHTRKQYILTQALGIDRFQLYFMEFVSCKYMYQKSNKDSLSTKSAYS